MALHLTVPSFEALFQVAPQHELVQVRSRSRGGLTSGTFWEHEEYDARGELVARYESFEETKASGQLATGWRKTGPDGRLLQAGPLRPTAFAQPCGSRAGLRSDPGPSRR
jgi:hypothetical protein